MSLFERLLLISTLTISRILKKTRKLKQHMIVRVNLWRFGPFSPYAGLLEFAITLANNDALAEAYSATLPTPFACDPSSNIPKSAFHKADRNSKSQEDQKTVHPDGQKSPELLPYHQEAHDEATQHLRTLYFEIEKNPTVALYNPNKYNGPSLAAKEAIDRIDEINGRLLTINCFSNLSIEVGQIVRDHFVETWKLFIYASEEEKKGTWLHWQICAKSSIIPANGRIFPQAAIAKLIDR